MGGFYKYTALIVSLVVVVFAGTAMGARVPGAAVKVSVFFTKKTKVYYYS